jgi:Ni,Fe-hydrogenase III large subunit
LEIQRSAQFLHEQLPSGPERVVEPNAGALAGDSIAVALVEGWRGEACHVGITDERGKLRAYKIVDPSFHNWIGLAMALRDQAISDFPLCNKSFNLSYCGFDL